MAIKPTCDKCLEELDAPGALVFGVPTLGGLVGKYHICEHCWKELLKWISGL